MVDGEETRRCCGVRSEDLLVQSCPGDRAGYLQLLSSPPKLGLRKGTAKVLGAFFTGKRLPGSGSAQSLLRIGSGLLTLITVFGRLHHIAC